MGQSKNSVNKCNICVVGWHFWPSFYKKISFLQNSVHVVAHRYNSLLENKNFSYNVKKNIGLEYGAYDWYIKNKWDKRSNILFMHDDISIGGNNAIYNLINKCSAFDLVHIIGKNEPKGIKFSFRCIYFSRRMIEKIKAYPLLAGFRGKGRTDIKTIIDVILKLGCIIDRINSISDIEINPLIVYKKGLGVKALDVRVILT